MTDVVANFTLGEEPSLTADFELGNEESLSAEFVLPNALYHDRLAHRDYPDQHPISAITNLQESINTINSTLDGKQDTLIAGANIQIEDNVISATDTRYTAGTGISIQGNVISNTQTSAEWGNIQGALTNQTDLWNTLSGLGSQIDANHTEIGIIGQTIGGYGNIVTHDVNEFATAAQGAKADTAVQPAAISNMVTTNTGQTISGAKTFSNTVTMAGQTPIAASHNYNSYAVFQRLPNTREQIFSNGGDKLRLRGSETRPQYNGNDLALYSDVTAEGADLTAHINNKNNPHEVTKAQVGLGNVSNLAPADLPVSTATQSALDAVNNDIDDIEELIPNQATVSNQLADKSFVNSSISTNTANFIGTFSSVQDLEDYSGTVTNNDYAFVETTDTVGNTFYDRYKYTDSTNSWQFEYELNNSSFTANQWAAINSGATSTNIGQIATNTNAITSINTTIGGYGNIVTYDVDDFATASQGAKADTAVQPADLATVATTGDYDDLIDKPTIPVVDQVYDATSSNAQSGVAVASAISGLQSLSAGDGINISSGVISVTAPAIVNNVAQYFSYVSIDGRSGTRANSSVSIAAKGNVGSGSISIGYDSYASGMASVAIGQGSVCSAIDSVAIGQESEANSGYSVAVGRRAKVAANCDTSIQLGAGLNNVYGTFQVGRYQMLEFSTGKIPNARINIDSQPASLSNNAVSSDGVYTALNDKQDTLVSGTNIKTINNNSILGSGDLTLDGLPSQAGHSGEFLTTDGTNASWADVDALPSQTGHSGDVLTTDGTDASWVDTDTIYPVIETYVNGASWYRVYSDGWIEQGGFVSSVSGDYTVNFLKPFVDTNYTILKTMSTNSTAGGMQYKQFAFFSRTASSATTATASADFSWYACGYGA